MVSGGGGGFTPAKTIPSNTDYSTFCFPQSFKPLSRVGGYVGLVGLIYKLAMEPTFIEKEK